MSRIIATTLLFSALSVPGIAAACALEGEGCTLAGQQADPGERKVERDPKREQPRQKSEAETEKAKPEQEKRGLFDLIRVVSI
jgi:hypothetical protein